MGAPRVLGGQVRNRPADHDEADLFEIATVVLGEQVALPADPTGCKMMPPA